MTTPAIPPISPADEVQVRTKCEACPDCHGSRISRRFTDERGTERIVACPACAFSADAYFTRWVPVSELARAFAAIPPLADPTPLSDGFYWVRIDRGRGQVDPGWTVCELRGGLLFEPGERQPVNAAEVEERVEKHG